MLLDNFYNTKPIIGNIRKKSLFYILHTEKINSPSMIEWVIKIVNKSKNHLPL